jgi:hypothetical protein
MNDVKTADGVISRLEKALGSLAKESAQGRIYVVGTKVTYKDKFGVVTELNKGSKDPEGSTVDIRLADGTVVERVPVASSILRFFRS